MMMEYAENVTVIGCGGIGSWLVPPLIRFLNAKQFKGRIALWDGDRFENKNTDRQEVTDDGLNCNKAEHMIERLRTGFPLLEVFAYPEYVTIDNIERVIQDKSIVFTCVDNHPCRTLVDKKSSELTDICVISAGNEYMDGNAHVSLRRNGKPLTQSLLERHPDIADVKAGDRAELGCEDLIEEGATQLLVTNFMAAGSALMAFNLLWMNGEKNGRRKIKTIPQEIYFDISQCKADIVVSETK